MGELRYSETVRATRLASALLLGAALALLLLAVLFVAGGETLAAIGAGVVGIALFAAFRTFGSLQIEVSETELTARFGNFRQRIELSRVSRVAVERYDWLPHGGWGIRFGLSRRRAYSVPFRLTGVRVEIPGARWYFSSARPVELASALERGLEDPSES
jgi:hypothetical protein